MEGLDTTEGPSQGGCVLDGMCCHISTATAFRINISAASPGKLFEDFLQPLGIVIYQLERST